MTAASAHTDTFARDNLPPRGQWPELLLDGFDYPERLNAGVELTDRMVECGFGDRTALIGNGRRRTYKELADWTNRIAAALVDDYGVKPGNRVLIRSANNPATVACWLAATKAGAVVVNTMPMLRAGELAKIVDKAEVGLALCDTRLMDEIVACAKRSGYLRTVVGFDGTANHDAELDRAALSKPVTFEAVETAADDVALLGFTSGSTGVPKATAHFHRDLLIIADGYAREVLGVTPDDVFVGSPPLAFTFGLGGLAVFPLRFGAAATLLETASPPNMVEIIQQYRATVCFTAPTAYRAMLKAMDGGRTSRRFGRRSVRARRCLPRSMTSGWPRPASRCSTGSARPRCCTSSSPTASTTTARPAPAARSEAMRPRSSTARCARCRGARSVSSPCAADRLPLPRRRAPARQCAGRLKPDRRRLRAGCRRLLPLRRAVGRHHPHVRLQHRRARGRGGAACPRRGAGMRRGRGAGRRARADRLRAWCFRPGPIRRSSPRSCCRITSRPRSRPTSNRAESCSRPSCPRPRPARSSASACARAPHDDHAPRLGRGGRRDGLRRF